MSDQEAQSRRIIEYCGLGWNDACLDFHRDKRVVNTASMTRVRQPIHKLLEPLLDALSELVRIANPHSHSKQHSNAVFSFTFAR